MFGVSIADNEEKKSNLTIINPPSLAKALSRH